MKLIHTYIYIRVLLQCWSKTGGIRGKTEIAYSLSKLGLLCSTYIQFKGTIKRKAVGTPTTRPGGFEHDQVESGTHVSV